MRDKSKTIILSLIIIIALLIVLILLMFMGVIGEKEKCGNEIIEQKSSVDISQIIKYYKSMVSDYEDDVHEYSVVDINNDNLPELLIYTHGVIGNAIIADTNVYTYDEILGNENNNYVLFVGTLTGSIDDDAIFYKMNDDKLLTVMGNMGYETVSYYVLENDWLVRTNTVSRDVEEYTVGDKEIIFKPCTDTSLLDEYK